MTAKTRKNIHFRILFRTETETEPNHAQYFFRIAQEFHGMAVALKIGTLTHGKKGRSFESESMAKNRLCAARTTV